MNRREFTAALLAVVPWAGLAHAGLNESEAAAGVRAALEHAVSAAVALLGRTDGFLGNPQVRIPLPADLKDAARLSRATSHRRQVEELETAMNRVAEVAVPAARSLFAGAARAISVEDALHIVRGGPIAVTDFFAAKTRVPLAEQFLPIVTRAAARLDLARRYNAFASRSARRGPVTGQEVQLQKYVTGRALQGLYRVIGEEERKIRADPAKTGSAILSKVFGR